MSKFVSPFKIRAKLLIAFGSIVFLSVILTVFALNAITKIISYKNLNEQIDQLSMQLERMELSVKEFIYNGYKSNEFQITGKSAIDSRFSSNFANANQVLTKIEDSHLFDDDSTRMMMLSLKGSLENLSKSFVEIKQLLKERGFKDSGLEGSLREAIHKIEQSGAPIDKATLLTLRRHEKDFFLRKDVKYIKDFTTTVQAFRSTLTDEGLLALLYNYEKQFMKVAEIENKIGLTDSDGNKAELYKELNVIRPQLEKFQLNVRSINEKQISGAKVFLVVIFSIQFICATALAIVYANVITSVIKEIRLAMLKLAQGDFPEKLVVRTSEEIGQTKIAFNQFLERLKAASSFAEKLGSGELKARYDERYQNDILAKAIIKMQQELVQAEERQSKINWTNEGIAQFSEIVKNESEDIKSLGDKILRMVVNYLRANQAALYVSNEEEHSFHRISTYAYGKKKFIDEKISYGTGLVGQCALEKNTIYLKEIPSDYVKITSGLGEATANNVVIIPLKIREEVNGVMELASFEIFKDYEIDFLERVAENVASLLYNRQSTDKTKKLLEESHKKAQTLAQQEEEMRQNAEELMATQEEMERQRRQLEHEIKELKNKLRVKELLID
jgi:methyl-accepting chemotaxis protein